MLITANLPNRAASDVLHDPAAPDASHMFTLGLPQEATFFGAHDITQVLKATRQCKQQELSGTLRVQQCEAKVDCRGGPAGWAALTPAKCSLTKLEKALGPLALAGVPSAWNLPRKASRPLHRLQAMRSVSMDLEWRLYT